MTSPHELSCKSTDWQTPESFLNLVRRVAPIGLDPCTTPTNPTGATRYMSAGGLTEPWVCPEGSLVFINPPYGRALKDWSHKITSESGCERIALVPARTDARWWHHMVRLADSTCLLRGRIAFIDPASGLPVKGNTVGSTVFYFGNQFSRFRDVFGDIGVVW